jgi:hypothetical protein
MGYTRREDRLYLGDPGVCWEGATNRNARPLGLHRPAPSNPILRDYKVYRISIADFEAAGSRSHYRLRWGGQAHRSGVPYTVRSDGHLFGGQGQAMLPSGADRDKAMLLRRTSVRIQEQRRKCLAVKSALAI